MQGDCGVRARMQFGADALRDNGGTGELGFVLAGALDEGCIDMVDEETRMTYQPPAQAAPSCPPHKSATRCPYQA